MLDAGEQGEPTRIGLKDEQILLFVFGSVTLRSLSECLEDARPRAPARQTNEPSNGIFNRDLSEVATGVHRDPLGSRKTVLYTSQLYCNQMVVLPAV
jgi:hypothetical protein